MSGDKNTASNNSTNLTFRTKEEVKEIREEKPVKPSEETETIVQKDEAKIPPTMYLEETNRPYLARILDIENTFRQLPKDVRINMMLIDDYFRKETKRGRYDNTEFGYKRFWENLLEIVNVRDYSTISKINLITEFISQLEKKQYE